MLDDLKFIHERDAHDALGSAERHWGVDVWSSVVPTARNQAKQIALEVIGKTPIIYSSEFLAPAAEHWKRGFNLHAKHLAWTGQFPEFLETELTGWSKQPVHKPFAVIELRSELDYPETQAAYDLAERALSGKRPAPNKVYVQGDNEPAQILWASALGDFVTIYTALLNGVNPTSRPFADKIHQLREQQ
ncbi:MAG: SIS domain-containing protein [Patescibacteria group bacterium]|nr:SIS domain-containing protein [Patescibacteria group bacterium]